MKIVGIVFILIRKIISIALIFAICVPLLFVAYKGNQPMRVSQVPAGMTYWQFMGDRIEAAKEVRPSRCGWGMFLSLAVIGPLYSVVYTVVGIHPDGFLARVTAPDPDIPKGVKDASWRQVPYIWWNVVERLSWTMLGKANPGCRFRPVTVEKNYQLDAYQEWLVTIPNSQIKYRLTAELVYPTLPAPYGKKHPGIDVNDAPS